ncbi:MAG TPA: periplasmic heavy metal sensor, partial [Casimicrobiaceae bacterium]
MDIEHVLAGLQAKLNLNTMQQGMWDAAVAQTKTARDTGRANMQKLHDAMATELTKATPNLASVAAAADDVQTSNQTLRHAVRDQWLKLYATFSSDQIAVVKAALQQRLARMDSFHQKMLERMQQKQGG